MDFDDLKQAIEDAKDSPSASAALLPHLADALATLAARVDTLERGKPAKASGAKG